MCGRFVVARPGSELVSVLRVDVEGDSLPQPSYNVAPTTRAAIVLDSAKTEPPTRRLEAARWGLVPGWAKDLSIGTKAINARSEEIETKPMFRSALESKRAIVPVSGYYEWQSTPQGKLAHYIHPTDHGPLFLAGLYEWWKNPALAADDPQRWVLSFTILTRAASQHLHPIHDRMPVFVDSDVAEGWLDPTVENVGDILDAAVDLAPSVADSLSVDRVSAAVGNVRNNDASLIEPVDSGTLTNDARADAEA